MCVLNHCGGNKITKVEAKIFTYQVQKTLKFLSHMSLIVYALAYFQAKK